MAASRSKKKSLTPLWIAAKEHHEEMAQMELFYAAAVPGKSSDVPGRVRSTDRGRRVARPASFYRFFLVRRLFVVVGTIEKVEELLRAGSIGAGLRVVLTLTFPDGVNVVFVRMRIFPPNFGGSVR